MKKSLLTPIIVVLGFTQVFTQIFEKHTELSVFTGVQNPREYAILDFSGSGPRESFDPGPLVGIGIKRNGKRISLGLRGTYMHNQLKDISDVEQNLSLHNFSFRGDFWINLLNPDSKFRIELGVGIGGIVFRHPGYTYIWDEYTDFPGRVDVTEPYWSYTFGLNSGTNLYYNLSKKMSIFAAIGNDFALYYGDEETAIQTSIAIGLAHKL